MMRWLPTIAVAAALLWLAPARAQESAKPVAPKKFDHDQHRTAPAGPVERPEDCNVVDGKPVKRSWRGAAVISTDKEDNCKSCHPTDKVGVLTKPGSSGHQPCLASGCHVTEFLRAGKPNHGCYEKAVAFCGGCHAKTPKNFEKAAADLVFRDHPNPNYHVELPHFEHLDNEIKGKGKVECRDCHRVDASSNQLLLNTPGHTECALCHGISALPMESCDQCHKIPGKRVFLDKLRKETEVRSCNSPGHEAEAKRRNKPIEEVPCFKHETKDHRFAEDGKALQCDACHYMFTDKKLGAKTYNDLKSIAAAPIINTERSFVHNRTCGATRACHKRDVSPTASASQCRKCHSGRVIANEFGGP